MNRIPLLLPRIPEVCEVIRREDLAAVRDARVDVQALENAVLERGRGEVRDEQPRGADAGEAEVCKVRHAHEGEVIVGRLNERGVDTAEVGEAAEAGEAA